MSIELSPTELGFHRPFQAEVTETLIIRNNHYEPVAFKVKTTAPKLYCVRPNSGRIEAGQHVQVQVILQSMKEDPPPDFRCRDKFLVQSVAITADRETQNLADIWNLINKEEIQEKKIRVAFLPPLPFAEPFNGPDAEVVPETPNIRALRKLDSCSQSEQKESIKPQTPTDIHQPGPLAPVSRPDMEGYPPTGQAVSHAHGANTISLAEFNAQQQALAEARATIELLRKQLQEQEGLRHRNLAGEKISQGATPLAIAQAPEGVPVKIVAALCLVSFLLALLF